MNDAAKLAVGFISKEITEFVQQYEPGLSDSEILSLMGAKKCLLNALHPKSDGQGDRKGCFYPQNPPQREV